MFIQEKKDMVQAILSYSPHRLEKLITSKPEADIFDHPIINHFDEDRNVRVKVLNEFDPNNERKVTEEEMVAMHCDGFTFPLHVAVVCVYHAIYKDPFCEHQLRKALKTIDVLIANGVNVHHGTGPLYLLNIEGYEWTTFSKNYPDNLPIHLAMFLKQHAWNTYSNQTHKYLGIVMDKLDAAAASKKVKLPTRPVLKQVTSAYNRLLFSEDFSDITFQCSDGVSVPAHKNILAASSDYFKTAFQGPWTENNEDGIWQTSHSSKLIKSVLTVLYTGSIEKCNELMKDNGVNKMDLFELSSEYGIGVLISLSVKSCIESIQKSNLKEYLQKAKFYSNNKLKVACFDYVKKNMAETLMDPDIMALAGDDQELWDELRSYCSGGNKPNKRARTNE